MTEEVEPYAQMESRKKDHIDLAFESRTAKHELDTRFYYEPVLNGHPKDDILETRFLGKVLRYPVWVSSMTGGTEKALKINTNLAKLCGNYGLGMGLGSCRPLLESYDRFEDFNMRPLLGEKVPFYANLGIAQLEELIAENSCEKVEKLVSDLNADGLIIHINPLQEWAQPEGDVINRPPIDTIEEFLGEISLPVIVKEVGQGMGPQSLRSLMKLPLAAIEFGAAGGTNFTRLELNRTGNEDDPKLPFINIGHTASEMVGFVNEILKNEKPMCNEFIISGGIRNYLDGYYHLQKCNSNAIYGQASSFLKYAIESYDMVENYFIQQMNGLKLAHSYLSVVK